MRLPAISIYVIIMICFLLEGFEAAFIAMLSFILLCIIFIPIYRETKIRVAKKKIYDTLKINKEGGEIKPFIEINSSPWFILAELPGVTINMAKYAAELREKEGLYPSIESFIKAAEVKPRFISSLRAIAYVKRK